MLVDLKAQHTYTITSEDFNATPPLSQILKWRKLWEQFGVLILSLNYLSLQLILLKVYIVYVTKGM